MQKYDVKKINSDTPCFLVLEIRFQNIEKTVTLYNEEQLDKP